MNNEINNVVGVSADGVSAGKEPDDFFSSLFSAGAHFGYSRTRRHPSAKQFIYGSKNRNDIIDLEATMQLLNKAIKFVDSLAKDGKQILFVGSKYEARKIIAEVAQKLGMPYSAERWIGGTLTNFSEIRKRIARLEDLMAKKEKGELDVFTKKERLLMDKEIEDLTRRFGGIVSMKKLPSAVFIVDTDDDFTAVNEAARAGIPIIGICATDCNLEKINYPIVANDSFSDSIRFFAEKIAEAYKNALKPKIGMPEEEETMSEIKNLS